MTSDPAQAGTQASGVAATAAAPAPPFAPGPPTRRGRARGGAAALVAAGILLSRLAGLIRQRVFGHYLGTSDAADAYNAAFKIPNFLQNLLGEGVLSASFIPVYAALRASGTPEGERESRRVASAVAGLLTLVTGIVALAGILLTPLLIDAIAPGFTGEKRLLTIRLVQIFFPGIALLVLSAFCIGVLNSHHRFFLSYVAPVVWSFAVVAALLFGGHLHADQARLARIAAFGAVVGGALQLAVQLPVVLRLLGGVREGGLWLSLGRGNAQVREVVRNFVPVVAGRGVVQLSAYLDSFIASWLPSGAVAALAYAQTIYLLPISLFGMSVSAAALPSMSAAQGAGDDAARKEALRAQVARGLRNIAYPVVPSVVALLVLGDVICAALFRTGQFGPGQVLYVSRIVLGSTVGLLAATLARLYSSAFYALRDTRTPLRYALLRVVITGVLGLVCGLWLPRALGLDPSLGAVGLTASAGLAGWVEFALLRRGVNARVGRVDLPGALQVRLWAAAAAAGAAGLGVRALLDLGPALLRAPVPRAVVVLGVFGAVYLLLTLALGVEEARSMARRLSPRRN